MNHLILGAALLAQSSATQPPKLDPIESQYDRWHSVSVDGKKGEALFVAVQDKAGNAVQFRLLKVHRVAIGFAGRRFDKELTGMLGDCGSRKYVETSYRFQLADAFTPPTMMQKRWPSVARPGSEEDRALTAACREQPAELPIESPYNWAKARLSGSGG